MEPEEQDTLFEPLSPYWRQTAKNLGKLGPEQFFREITWLPEMEKIRGDDLIEILRVFSAQRAILQQKQNYGFFEVPFNDAPSDEEGPKRNKIMRLNPKNTWENTVEIKKRSKEERPENWVVNVNTPEEQPTAKKGQQPKTLSEQWIHRMDEELSSLPWKKIVKIHQYALVLHLSMPPAFFCHFLDCGAEHLDEANRHELVSLPEGMRIHKFYPTQHFENKFYPCVATQIPSFSRSNLFRFLSSSSALGAPLPENILKDCLCVGEKFLPQMPIRETSGFYRALAIQSVLTALPKEALTFIDKLERRILVQPRETKHENSCHFAWLRFHDGKKGPFKPILDEMPSDGEIAFINRLSELGFTPRASGWTPLLAKPDGAFVVDGKKLSLEHDGGNHFVRSVHDEYLSYVNGNTCLMSNLRETLEPETIHIRLWREDAERLRLSNKNLLINFMIDASELPFGSYCFAFAQKNDFVFKPAIWAKLPTPEADAVWSDENRQGLFLWRESLRAKDPFRHNPKIHGSFWTHSS